MPIIGCDNESLRFSHKCVNETAVAAFSLDRYATDVLYLESVKSPTVDAQGDFSQLAILNNEGGEICLKSPA